MHALRSANIGGGLLEVVRILELNLGHRSTTALVVDDGLHDTLGISVSLGEVQLLVADRATSSDGLGLEDGALTSSATANNSLPILNIESKN